MLREKTKKEVQFFCKRNNLEFINIRSFIESGKSRIAITFKCKECGKRYDVSKDTLFRQKFPGLCTSCAHKRMQDKKRLDVQYIVDFFEKNGYEVVTPIEKIKPRGKNKTYNKSIVEIKNRHGDIFEVCYNNFYNRLQYYIDMNEAEPTNDLKGRESRLEHKVRIYLEELNIPYKSQFRYKDCRGKKYPMPFDFCLWYNIPEKRKLIEVDGSQHFRKEFVEIQNHDRIKDYYCKKNNIPLLRLPYFDFNKNEDYKKKIEQFINT